MDTYATYSPEDNKLRLYVGRVPREEFLKLRAEGWTTLHKQREAGGGDFAAVWTPQRRATALQYSDIIFDEDMGPEERAADRAERFGEYRDKRTEEATGTADRYEAGPAAHGYQSEARAIRAVERHNRIADNAVDAWSKAEYWQRRTAGVISHALHLSSPGVRMGRIKTIEAELRKERAEIEERQRNWRNWCKLRDIADPEKQTKAILQYVGSVHQWGHYLHPRAAAQSREHRRTTEQDIYSLMTGEDPITGAEACALFFSDHSEPASENTWTQHHTLRLRYENQMLEAQGGRLEQFEVLPGGKLGNKLIIKVSKSAVTGRATSCDIIGPKVSGWAYKVSNLPGTDLAAYKFDLERLAPGAYTAPTPESLKELEEVRAKIKAGAKKTKGDPCPLINPTDEDAARLQKVWNEAEGDPARHSEPVRMTQEQYSARSGTAYASCSTVVICETGCEHRRRYGRALTRSNIFKVRKTGPDHSKSTMYGADRVIIITDKPQKPIPWDAIAEAAEAAPSLAKLLPRLGELEQAMIGNMRGADKSQLIEDADYVGLVNAECSQAQWTEKGMKALNAWHDSNTVPA
jgi:hypothetical protein